MTDPDPPGGGDEPASVLTDLVSIGAGQAHTCAVNGEGRAFCWGSNAYGQLGTGSFSLAPDLTPLETAQGTQAFRSIRAGEDHTCALTPTKEIWCWGSDEHRQLGYFTADSMEVCSGVSCLSFPWPVIDGTRFGTYATGHGFTCAGTSLGTPYCWGDNSKGQGGTGGLSPRLDYAWPTGGQHLVRQVVAGSAHVCAVELDGRTLCWGDDTYGQLGSTEACPGFEDICPVPRPLDGEWAFSDLTAGDGHTCAIDGAGAAFCWGRGADGALGDGGTRGRDAPVAVATSVRFSELAAGGHHTCGLSTDGAVYCWGDNERGQLGLGGSGPARAVVPTRVEGSTVYVHVSAGERHTCAISTDGGAFCWGGNEEGQLGDGTTTDRHGPVSVAGVGG